MDNEIFWTDSNIILSYTNTDVRWFKVFVENKFQQIRDHASPKQ